MLKTNLIYIFLALMVMAGVSVARADADQTGAENWAEPSPSASEHEEPKRSDAQFDKRLPPVLPGEEVSDGKRTMKVWSTADSPIEDHHYGRVPRVPRAPNLDNDSPQIGSVGVVVDQRDRQDSTQAK